MTKQITAIAPWFGSNRMLAQHVGQELMGCSWVVVPFAGGCCELSYIKARTIVASDLHCHVINLCNVLKTPATALMLYRSMDRTVFDERALTDAQAFCLGVERCGPAQRPTMPDVVWAENYFITCWMARSGRAGTKDEFKTGISIRYEVGGGDSVVRFRSAVSIIPSFHRVLNKVEFLVRDAFAMIEEVKDEPWVGIYNDTPFEGPGKAYKHQFDAAAQRRYAIVMNQYRQARVVCRFYDHPLVRELYPEPRWTWVRLDGRKMTNDKAPEVLILNGPSRATMPPASEPDAAADQTQLF